MAKADYGIGKGDVATGTLSYVVIVFLSIAIYNVIELTFIIWTTFKRRGGLYFWSFIVSTYGIAIYSAGFILMNETPNWQSWLYATCVVVGWPMMVTGQSMVLYSRLHLVLLDQRILRAVLWMIIIDACITHIPVIVFIYGVNVSSVPERFVDVYSVYEKVQVTIFFVQECIISALYISETVKTMRLQRELSNSRGTRRLLKHLIMINVIIIGIDITILGLEYANLYLIQTSYKALAYAAKLKLEFSILNKLVEVTTADKELSGASHLSTTAAANAIGYPLDQTDGDSTTRSHKRRRPNASYRASIRGGQSAAALSSEDSEERAAATGAGGVTMTREVVVRRDTRVEGDGDSVFDLGIWRSGGADETVAIPMEDIEAALKGCSQVHLQPGTWPHDQP